MGRKKKEAPPVIGDGKGTPPSEPKPEKKSKVIKVTAKYRSKDEEGNKVIVSLNGEGKDAKEIIESLKLPKGLAANVVITLDNGDEVLERSLAPYKVFSIFTEKDEEVLRSAFRGYPGL